MRDSYIKRGKKKWFGKKGSEILIVYSDDKIKIINLRLIMQGVFGGETFSYKYA